MGITKGIVHNIYDPLYGFIRLTSIEWDIIHSPFYQRLRWIKQLGFSSYVFPGAEHSRFAHSIGVMHNAHLILQSCGRAVPDRELFDPEYMSKEKVYNQSVRLGALMHDLGTFCFSHTTEGAYVEFGETNKTSKTQDRDKLKDDHENLGSYIIKNTDCDDGITRILTEGGFDPKHISDLVKGQSPSIMANQILHSQIDCDRMDYLLRDAYYTGLRYGSYDRDYLLYHFNSRRVGKHDILTISHNALRCIEDFLGARFSWYSQVVRSHRGARYDAIAEKICFHLLKKGIIYRYSDLLDMISNDPVKFFGFNDTYFISLVHKCYSDGTLDKFPDIKDMALTLMLERRVKLARCDELKQRLLDQDDHSTNKAIYKRADNKAKEIMDVIKSKGSAKDWGISDMPKKDIVFVKSHQRVLKSSRTNVLLERDPVKISYENGDIKLLTELEDSVILRLQRTSNFIPNVFLSQSSYYLLLMEGVIDDEFVQIPV